MVEGDFRCPECGQKFETPQALGSHLKYEKERVLKHEGRGASSSSEESLDLKHDFVGLLEDVGVRRGSKTIADIFFGLGGDSPENLDMVLRLAGVTNPSKALILRRWAQRVNSEVPEELLKGKESEQRTGDVFETYEKVREAELSELLFEDLRSRIKERRRQSSGGDETKTLLDKLEKLENEVKDLKSMQNAAERPEHRQSLGPPYPREHQQLETDPHSCNNPYHLQPCFVCKCGFHGSIRYVRIGSHFSCPRCGKSYFRAY